jgi:hypothetical protein
MDTNNKGLNKEPETKNNAPANNNAGNVAGNGNAGNANPSNGNSGSGNPGNGNLGNGGVGNGNSGENSTNGNNGNAGPKDITVIVNGTPHVVAKEEMTFREIIALAELASGPNVSYTLTYRKGHGNKPEGSLVEGDVVKVKDGMIFNATATDKS